MSDLEDGIESKHDQFLVMCFKSFVGLESVNREMCAGTQGEPARRNGRYCLSNALRRENSVYISEAVKRDRFCVAGIRGLPS